MPNRTCRIDGNGGTLTVRLTVTNLLNAGARFILVDTSEKKRAEWTMEPGDDGVDEHPLTEFPPSSLNGFYIKWLIRSCSGHPHVESGNVRVEILQGGGIVAMAPLAAWTPKVPQCSTGTAHRITDFVDLISQ